MNVNERLSSERQMIDSPKEAQQRRGGEVGHGRTAQPVSLSCADGNCHDLRHSFSITDTKAVRRQLPERPWDPTPNPSGLTERAEDGVLIEKQSWLGKKKKREKEIYHLE